ncbi:MAG: excinuclease ABC subunit UvrB [Firmicutes bacterium]|nr:excinuclease ABC subunit UvrB [Bacillota bacterium]MDY5335186.1 excinuclease ABC subunit UvrB [Bacilli bacterium]
MFKLVSKYKPSGDQPEAIKELVQGIKEGKKEQVLLGATGTGKTFTIANVIEKTNKPTLVLAHNKTLAGQLYNELKELFPENRVEYFVSYYDYYQPEAYVPSTDTYIEKDSSINDEIDELRHSATSALISRSDVIVVASVSCIYGIGEIEEYKKKMLTLTVGDTIDRDIILKKLIEMLYERNDIDLKRGTFRVRGDSLEIVPAYERTNGLLIEWFGDEIDRISEVDTITGHILKDKKTVSIFAASHFVTDEERLKISIERINKEKEERVKYFKENNKLIEAQRIEERVNYDMEMLSETGFCRGIENYSRHIALKEEGESPNTLIDFFPKDFLLVIDESHVTLPQVRAMYNGDRARKMNLVDYGFRLPSALDNRPLKFEEFTKKLNDVIYVSATPGDYEMERVNNKVVEQIIRPTGLLDPLIEVRPTKNQIDNLVEEINKQIEKNERTLITTLTIRMAEELTNYLKSLDIKVAYLHSEVKTLERLKIIRDLRLGKYDVVVGINLLREGIDIPEVSLIAIMDADKQGFLRSTRSLIQTIGRAARNSSGRVIMYADIISDSMNEAITETERRRSIQEKYNKEHGIIPKTIIKDIPEVISNETEKKVEKESKLSKKEKLDLIDSLTKEMKSAASNLDFERAMELRDIIFDLENDK